MLRHIAHFGNITAQTGTMDADGDGLSNLTEYQLGLDPNSVDADGDRLPDAWEVERGFDPADPTHGVRIIRFDEQPVLSYGGPGQDADPDQYEILHGGTQLHLWGNNWKAIRVDATVGPSTWLRYRIRVGGEPAEINGVGLDTDLMLTSTTFFKNAGTQNDFGKRDYDNYAGSNWRDYAIPIGKYFTGFFPYLVFANDADAGQATSVYYADVMIGGDADGDGLLNYEEHLLGTDPRNVDTDSGSGPISTADNTSGRGGACSMWVRIRPTRVTGIGVSGSTPI